MGFLAGTNSNPCRNTRRDKMKPVERFLTAEEMARLNAVLTRDEFWCPNVVAIVRLLMLTGCRFGEVVSLEWDWIRDKRIHLPDSKSGPRTVWLSSAARGHLRCGGWRTELRSPDVRSGDPLRSPESWSKATNMARLVVAGSIGAAQPIRNRVNAAADAARGRQTSLHRCYGQHL